MSKKKTASKHTQPGKPVQQKVPTASQKKSAQLAQKKKSQSKLQPWMLVTIVLIAVAAIGATAMVFMNQDARTVEKLPASVTVQEAYNLFNQGAFVLDVRTQEEWDEYHIPNTTLIPLDQLAGRLSEVPQNRQIVVVCRSGNRSQEGRDILLQAGYDVTSMNGGLIDWRMADYPIE